MWEGWRNVVWRMFRDVFAVCRWTFVYPPIKTSNILQISVLKQIKYRLGGLYLLVELHREVSGQNLIFVCVFFVLPFNSDGGFVVAVATSFQSCLKSNISN